MQQKELKDYITEGNYDAVEKFLSNPNCMNDLVSNDNEWYCICLAAQSGHFKILELLLSNDQLNAWVAAPKHRVEKLINHALNLAAAQGHLKCVELLLKENAVNIELAIYRDNNALKKACESAHSEIVEALLKNDYIRQYIIDNPSLFFDSVKNDATDIVNAFLIANHTYNLFNKNVLLEAVSIAISKNNYSLAYRIIKNLCPD